MCDIWKRKDGRARHAADLERHRESIRKLRVEHVVLTGGEPLLNRELDAICEFFRDLGVRTTLLTTGLLLLKKADIVTAGFDDIIISIDGPAEIHDRVRRVPGAFEAIRRGVSDLRERYPERIVIFDLPPLLGADDALAFLPLIECGLMVVS